MYSHIWEHSEPSLTAGKHAGMPYRKTWVNQSHYEIGFAISSGVAGLWKSSDGWSGEFPQHLVDSYRNQNEDGWRLLVGQSTTDSLNVYVM